MAATFCLLVNPLSMPDAGQTLEVSFDVNPRQPGDHQILHLSALAPTTPRTVSGLVFFDRSGIWRVGPLEANLAAGTKRLFLILGALVVLGDGGSVVFTISESPAITATAIVIALVLSAATELKPSRDRLGRNQSDFVTSAKLSVPTAETAMASSAAN